MNADSTLVMYAAGTLLYLVLVIAYALNGERGRMVTSSAFFIWGLILSYEQYKVCQGIQDD